MFKGYTGSPIKLKHPGHWGELARGYCNYNYTTLHYINYITLISLHYAKLHDITLHYTNYNYSYNYNCNYTTLHYTPPDYSTQHYTQFSLHYTKQHYITPTTTAARTTTTPTLHYITLR